MTDYQKMLDLFRAIGVKVELVEGYFSPGGIKTDPAGIVKFQGLSIVAYDGQDEITHEFLMDGSYWRTATGSAYSA